MEKQRLQILDVLRGLAVVFMALVHIQNVYADFSLPGETTRVIFDFLGGPPAAPVFMMIMGFLFAQKEGVTLRNSLFRGLVLVGLGYALNILRGVVPVFIGRQLLAMPPERFPAMFTYEFLFFEVDILIFAGLAYICMGLLRRISHRPVVWELAAFSAALVSPFIWGAGESVPVLCRFVQPLWGSDPDLVTFPLLPWLFFPLQGMALGALYGKHHNRFAVLLAASGAAAVAFGVVFLVRDFDRYFNDYGQMKAAGLIAITGFVLLWSLGIGLLDRKWPVRFRTGILAFLGRNVTVFYVVHWLIIGWSLLLLTPDSFSNLLVVATAVLVTAVSGLITRLYLRLHRNCKA